MNKRIGLKLKHLIIGQENRVIKQRSGDDLEDTVNILKTKGIIKYAKQDRTEKKKNHQAKTDQNVTMQRRLKPDLNTLMRQRD